MINVSTLFTWLMLALIAFAGCRHRPLPPARTSVEPDFQVPAAYTHQFPGEHRVISPWWREFNDPRLNELIEAGLTQNYSLKQAWNRLRQAQLTVALVKAELPAKINLAAGASRTRVVDREIRNREDPASRFSFAPRLSYEWDVWQRLESLTQAAERRSQATQFDADSTSLLIAGLIADAWFTLIEKASLLKLLDDQIATAKTELELIELRFSQGKGNALAVLQQRQQVAALAAERPPLVEAWELMRHQLATLSGKPVGEFVNLILAHALPVLPPFPDAVAPADLIHTRPDLRAALARLQAEDYEVAAAIAERYPRFNLTLSYELSATRPIDMFIREIGSISGDLVYPWLDGGRREIEIERRRAEVEERLLAYSELYLNALQEVEDALTREKYQLELIKELENQRAYAAATLEESRSRYLHGLDNYLAVVVAQQTLQQLDRRMLSERKELLAHRARLYRALGTGNDDRRTNQDGGAATQF